MFDEILEQAGVSALAEQKAVLEEKGSTLMAEKKKFRDPCAVRPVGDTSVENEKAPAPVTEKLIQRKSISGDDGSPASASSVCI